MKARSLQARYAFVTGLRSTDHGKGRAYQLDIV